MPPMPTPYRTALPLMLLVLLADQASKTWLLAALEGGGFMEITPFFNLTMVWNRGVSFGLFNSPDAAQYQPWLLSLLALVIVGFLLRWLKRQPGKLPAWGVGLVAGGALGNVIDRARFGAVADFFDLHISGWHWPAFNVADAAICIGVALLVAQGMLAPSSKDNPP